MEPCDSSSRSSTTSEISSIALRKVLFAISSARVTASFLSKDCGLANSTTYCLDTNTLGERSPSATAVSRQCGGALGLRDVSHSPNRPTLVPRLRVAQDLIGDELGERVQERQQLRQHLLRLPLASEALNLPPSVHGVRACYVASCRSRLAL